MTIQTAAHKAPVHTVGTDHTPASPRALAWQHLALMSFAVVWGFSNVVTNFANQGLSVIFSWIIIMAAYFLPYTLMVGEMGAGFPEARSGVAAWIRSTLGSGWAYLCGWTYWVVHIPYLAYKPLSLLVAADWATQGAGGTLARYPVWGVQLAALLVLLGFIWLATRGIRPVKVLGTAAGAASFLMGLLYILLMLAAPALRSAQVATPRMTSLSTYLPHLDLSYFTSIALLVVAVGGAEKLSPYAASMRDSRRGFPQGLIAMAMLVAFSAVLGSLAMGMMFDVNHMDAKTLADFKTNGQYLAFQKLGQYYGVGNAFMVAQATANLVVHAAILLISIDAPLRMMLAEADERHVPQPLRRLNEHGAPVNGYLLTAALVAPLLLLPALGVDSLTELFTDLLDLNAVVMPMRYLFVFVAFIAMRRLVRRPALGPDTRLVRSDRLAVAMGAWCFVFTVLACLLGMIPVNVPFGTASWWGKLALNLVTPLALVSLGLIMPLIAERQLGLPRR